ncbi:MAG: branched-chain amino acid ABC transporter substrate-binding protein [Actinomycetota bacterium]|nr:branched-chain amino acid ABC transporter substrate-binding protein [Actinomycetota bacterium]
MPLVAASLVLSACGSRSDNKGSSSGGSKTATIGVIAPLSGDLSAVGLGIQHSVELAVKQANDKKTVSGWTFKVDPEDDQATPATGQQAATKLASDATVVGVVGTLNSSVAQTVIPVLDKSNIVQVSPSNTNPSLTQGANFATAPARPNKNYFRVCTTDSIQGPFAAQYIFKTLGMKNVATVSDQKTYGAGLVAAFTKEFKKLGGTIVTAQTINPDDKDFSGVISRVAQAKPDIVYYGGEYPQAAPLSKQMKGKGLKVPLMGGDGIKSDTYMKLTGAAGAGDLATSVGAPVEGLDSAKQFVADYTAAKFKEPYEQYGGYAYDAANAIIQALKTSLAGKDKVDASVRTATEAAMASVSFAGVTGDVAFDQYGDAKAKVLTVSKVEGGKWVDVKTGSLEG